MGGPGFPHLVLGPLQLLTHVDNLIVDNPGGLGPGTALYIPRLSHHPLGLTDLSYEQLGPVPGIIPLTIN